MKKIKEKILPNLEIDSYGTKLDEIYVDSKIATLVKDEKLDNLENSLYDQLKLDKNIYIWNGASDKYFGKKGSHFINSYLDFEEKKIYAVNETVSAKDAYGSRRKLKREYFNWFFGKQQLSFWFNEKTSQLEIDEKRFNISFSINLQKELVADFSKEVKSINLFFNIEKEEFVGGYLQWRNLSFKIDKIVQIGDKKKMVNDTLSLKEGIQSTALPILLLLFSAFIYFLSQNSFLTVNSSFKSIFGILLFISFFVVLGYVQAIYQLLVSNNFFNNREYKNSVLKVWGFFFFSLFIGMFFSGVEEYKLLFQTLLITGLFGIFISPNFIISKYIKASILMHRFKYFFINSGDINFNQNNFVQSSFSREELLDINSRAEAGENILNIFRKYRDKKVKIWLYKDRLDGELFYDRITFTETEIEEARAFKPIKGERPNPYLWSLKERDISIGDILEAYETEKKIGKAKPISILEELIEFIKYKNLRENDL